MTKQKKKATQCSTKTIKEVGNRVRNRPAGEVSFLIVAAAALCGANEQYASRSFCYRQLWQAAMLLHFVGNTNTYTHSIYLNGCLSFPYSISFQFRCLRCLRCVFAAASGLPICGLSTNSSPATRQILSQRHALLAAHLPSHFACIIAGISLPQNVWLFVDICIIYLIFWFR